MFEQPFPPAANFSGLSLVVVSRPASSSVPDSAVCSVQCTYTYTYLSIPSPLCLQHALSEKGNSHISCFLRFSFSFPDTGTQGVFDYNTNYKMVAPKAEIPLYHQSREHGRPSFSRRKRASAGSKRRSGGNTMWWWLVIISPLVLVAFCLGTFLGIELSRAPTKDAALGQGMFADQCPRRWGGMSHKGWVVEIS